jgi:hypothetical protein
LVVLETEFSPLAFTALSGSGGQQQKWLKVFADKLPEKDEEQGAARKPKNPTFEVKRHLLEQTLKNSDHFYDRWNNHMSLLGTRATNDCGSIARATATPLYLIHPTLPTHLFTSSMSVSHTTLVTT